MNRVLAYEYILAVGIVSWAAIKGQGKPGTKHHQSYMPWPPTIVYTSLSFGILSFVAAASAPLAGTLGAGFMLAALTRALTPREGKSKYALSPLSGMTGKTWNRYEAYPETIIKL